MARSALGGTARAAATHRAQRCSPVQHTENEKIYSHFVISGIANQQIIK